MARLKKKTLEVQKFGGVEDISTIRLEGDTKAPVENANYELKSIEAQSKTKLEDDSGYGNAAVIRCFEFGMNVEAFKQAQPTKQQLFNSHLKGIEIALWKDGLKILTEVNPRIVIDEQEMKYKIFVGATPQRGHILHQTPQTLRDIAHGTHG